MRRICWRRRRPTGARRSNGGPSARLRRTSATRRHTVAHESVLEEDRRRARHQGRRPGLPALRPRAEQARRGRHRRRRRARHHPRAGPADHRREGRGGRQHRCVHHRRRPQFRPADASRRRRGPRRERGAVGGVEDPRRQGAPPVRGQAVPRRSSRGGRRRGHHGQDLQGLRRRPHRDGRPAGGVFRQLRGVRGDGIAAVRRWPGHPRRGDQARRPQGAAGQPRRGPRGDAEEPQGLHPRVRSGAHRRRRRRGCVGRAGLRAGPDHRRSRGNPVGDAALRCARDPAYRIWASAR